MVDSNNIPLALNFDVNGRLKGFRQATDINVTSINAASALFTGPLSAATFYASSFTISALTVTSLDANILNVALFEPNNIITNYLSATSFDADTFSVQELNLTSLSATNSYLPNVQVTAIVGDSISVTNVTGINGSLDVIQNLSFFGNEAAIAALTATTSRLISTNIVTGNIGTLNTTSLNAVSFNPANITTTNLTAVSLTTTSLNAVTFNPANITTTNLTAINFSSNSITAINLNSTNFNPANINTTNLTATNFNNTNATSVNSLITTLNATNGIISFIQNVQIATTLVDTLDLTATNSRLRYPLILSGTANNLSGSNLLFTSVTAVDTRITNLTGTAGSFNTFSATTLTGVNVTFGSVTATNLNTANFNPATINSTNVTATNGSFTNVTALTIQGGTSRYTNIYGTDAVITNTSSTTDQADQSWIKDLSSTRDFAINSSGLTIDTWQIRFPSVTAHNGNQAPYSALLLVSANTYHGNSYHAGAASPPTAGKDIIGARYVDSAYTIVGDSIFIGGNVFWPAAIRHPSNPGYAGSFNPNDFTGFPPPTSSTYLTVTAINGGAGTTMPLGLVFHSGEEETDYIVGYVDHVTTAIAVAPVLDAPTVDTVFVTYNKETLHRSFVNYAGPTAPIQGNLTVLGTLSSVNLTGTNISATNVTATNLIVENNIIVGGTVDGVDISTANTTLTNHITSASVHFTAESLTSLYSVTSHNHAISSLTDSQITGTPVNNSVLAWSSTKWIPSSVVFPTVITDHGLLTGLEDNDHPQYVLTSVNSSLSSEVSNHLASASVHFTAESLTALYSVTSHNHALSGLTDIQITATPTNGTTLTWSSTKWIPSSVAGGVTDHGALTGLSDDDHTQYILVNGSRAFTNNVSGIEPTLSAHLAQKGYVDAKQWSTSNLSGGVLSVARGGLGSASFTENDLIFYDGSKFNSIPIGNENDVVKVIGGVWATAPDDTAGGSTISATNVTSINISAINLTATNFRVNGSTLGTAAFLNEGLGAGDLLTVLNAVLNFAGVTHTHAATDITTGTLARDVNNTNTTTTNLAVTSITTGGGFTNVVSGVAPTNSTHLVTKGYLDSWMSSIKLESDASATTTTVIPVTGMGFTVEANSDYLYWFYLHTKTSIAATGIRVGVSGPAGTTYVSHKTEVPTSNTALANRFDGAFGTNNALGTALPTNTLTYLAKGEGLIRTGGSPGATVVCPTIAAEAATASVAALAGSVMMVRKI